MKSNLIKEISKIYRIEISDMTYLYETVKSLDIIDTHVFNQFRNRGIPVAEKIADNIGISNEEFREYLSNGNVDFQKLHQALEDIVSEVK